MSPRSRPTRSSLVVYAKDKSRVSRFYRATLGLEAVESEPSYDRLAGAGIELIVHAIPAPLAATIDVTRPPRPREETPFKPVFECADLRVVRRAARATGGALKPASASWRWNGRILLDGWDPEGNIVQFAEPEAVRARPSPPRAGGGAARPKR